MIGAITGIIGLVRTVAGSWTERKKIVSQGKIAITQAKVDGKIKQIQTREDHNAEYDKIVAKGMQYSWKDEYWTIILSIPAVLCFVPGLDIYVKKGFEALATCPTWYQTCLVGAIVASFGLKSFDWFRKRNG